MAQTPPSAGRPGRQLIALGLVFAFLYGLMLFSGTGGMTWTERLEPRLGIDLVGGTRVTLRATTEQGNPSEDQLERAREIIENRVNAYGVEEAEVVSEGEDRIVVTVAGEPESSLNDVGAPAELRFRKVLEKIGGTGVPPDTALTPTPSPGATPDPSATPSPQATPSPEATPGADAAASPTPSGEGGGQGGEVQATPTPTPEATGSPTPTPSPSPEPEVGGAYGTVEERQRAVEEKISDEAMAAAFSLLDPATAQDPELDQQALLDSLREFETLTGPEVSVLPAKLQFNIPTISCAQLNDRPPGSIQDETEMVVACDEAGLEKSLLDVSKVLGTDVDDANGILPAGTNRWQVNISFTGGGQPKWTDLTREATQNDTATPFDVTLLGMNVVIDEESGEWSFDTTPAATEQNNLYQGQPAAGGEPAPVACGQQTLGDAGNCLVATVLDKKIVSAPQIQDVIPGDATIFGDFDSESANLLASQLRFGALPVTFEAQEGQSITATLGVEYLRAGLLAAAIGFGLVLLYSFFYYRLLGIVIFGSLIVSSLLTYAAVVVLGRSIGFTLTLAGISGFIVAVGIAADSFVIYFERLKDEIREGRTARSAIPRAWHRARRTIITANAVTMLAAVVLYMLSAGQVRGFAFALGLSTLLDLLIVFTFRHPIMTMLARTKAFLSPTVSGLGRALELDKARGIRPASAREASAPAREAKA